MNYPAASNGVSIGNYYRPKGRGIKPLSAEGGLNIKPSTVEPLNPEPLNLSNLNGSVTFL